MNVRLLLFLLLSGLVWSCKKLTDAPQPTCFIPYVDFVAYNINPSTLEVSFTSVSSFNGNITSHHWDFGDGTTFSGPVPPPHRYPAQSANDTGRVYRVKYTVRNECGEAFWTKEVRLNRCLANVGFTYTKLNDSTVRFQNTTTSGSNVTYEWTFGDGTTSTSTANEITKVYRFNGSYTVTLKAINACGENFFIARIPVCRKPVPVQQVQVNSCGQVTINAAGTTNGERFQWDFGNGVVLPAAPSTSSSITYTYPAPGQYAIRMKVWNNGNCDSAVTTTNVTVQSSALGTNRQWSYTSDDLNFQFSRTPVANATGYKWNFSDGSSLNGLSVSKQFTTPGTYTVQLIAFNDCAADTFQQTFSVPFIKTITGAAALSFTQVEVVSPQNIYLLSTNGLVYRTDTAGNWSAPILLPPSLTFNNNTRLFKDVNNQLWVFGRGNIARLNPSNNTWTSFFSNTGYNSNTTITDMTVDAANNIWTVANGEVRRNQTEINSQGNVNFSSITFAPGTNTIWATANNRTQLFSVSPTGNQFNTVTNNGISGGADDIMVASNGELFFSTGTGIVRANSSGGLLTSYNSSNTNGLLTGRPSAFDLDDEGFIWALQNNRLLKIPVAGGTTVNYSQNGTLTSLNDVSVLRLSLTDHDLILTKSTGNAALHVK